MRIAIIFGVSEYAESGQSLPAAANDAAAMRGLIEAIGDYQPVLFLAGRLDAEATKRQVWAFLEPFEGASVDEVLFYYSGHGTVVPSGLAFAMSDYGDRRAISGSFENQELDNYLRSVHPKVAVKILDCCYSGTQYVKGPSIAARVPLDSDGQFKACYFFSSSRHDQESWVGDGPGCLSVFTQYFLDAVANLPDGVVRYKQIADSISDRLINAQEPHFIVQGSMRHEFCTINERVRLAASVKPIEVESDGRCAESEVEESGAENLVAIVRGREELYITQAEAVSSLAQLRTRLEALGPHEMLNPVYEEKYWFPGTIDLEDDLADEEEIGRWLKHNGRGFFGWATETDPRRRPMSFASMASTAIGFPERPEVTGFVASADVDYDRFFLRHFPEFSGLARWEMATVILWSSTRAAVFSYGVPLLRRSWERYDQPERVGWVRQMFSRNELSSMPGYVVSRVLDHRETVASYLQKYIHARS